LPGHCLWIKPPGLELSRGAIQHGLSTPLSAPEQARAIFLIKIGSLALGSIALYAIDRTVEAAAALGTAAVFSVVFLYAETDREYPGRRVDEPENQRSISDLHPPLHSWLSRDAPPPAPASKDLASTNVTEPEDLLPASALPPAEQDLQTQIKASPDGSVAGQMSANIVTASQGSSK
jgi:hypothetical protein